MHDPAFCLGDDGDPREAAAPVGPDCPHAVVPVHQCGHTDLLDRIGANGMVSVPDGVGLGIDYDRNSSNATARRIPSEGDSMMSARTGGRVFSEMPGSWSG